MRQIAPAAAALALSAALTAAMEAAPAGVDEALAAGHAVLASADGVDLDYLAALEDSPDELDQGRADNVGELVAYAWAGPADDNWDIYVKGLGPGTSPLRLTDDPARDTSPVWSPDGRQIAFLRSLDGRNSIHTVPSLGGQERKLVDVGASVRRVRDWNNSSPMTS